MRKSTAFIIISLLVTGVTTSAFASSGKMDHGEGNSSARVHDTGRGNHNDNSQRGWSDHGMFKGLNLTREQREQIRDLMRKGHNDRPAFSQANRDAMHKFIISDQFDEAAVRQQATLNEKERIDFRVEEIRIRHQIYNLLTPAQKENFNQRLQSNQHD